MKKTTITITALAAVALTPALAPGQQTPNAVTLGAAPALVTAGVGTVLSGQVTGADNAGVRVDLQADDFPLADFRNAGQSATTDASGNYSFTVKPTLLTRYRVTAKAKPQVESAAVDVRVRPAMTLAVSDGSVRRGARVTFTGTVTPAHDASKVRLQRRIGTGSFRTIATPTLVASGAGLSAFSQRVRVRRTATYRVRLSAHADHATGTSPKRRVRVR